MGHYCSFVNPLYWLHGRGRALLQREKRGCHDLKAHPKCYRMLVMQSNPCLLQFVSHKHVASIMTAIKCLATAEPGNIVSGGPGNWFIPITCDCPSLMAQTAWLLRDSLKECLPPVFSLKGRVKVTIVKGDN